MQIPGLSGCFRKTVMPPDLPPAKFLVGRTNEGEPVVEIVPGDLRSRPVRQFLARLQELPGFPVVGGGQAEAIECAMVVVSGV